MVRPPKLQAALRVLKNPYASLQIDDHEEAQDLQLHALWRKSENPYAQDYYLGRDAIESAESPPPRQQIFAAEARGTLSQFDFDKQARAIFRPYIPAEEKARLRPHYREFIERNRSRDPHSRFNLIAQLRRYDLSELAGLSPQFNREEDLFTKDKLQEIERRAGLGKDGAGS